MQNAKVSEKDEDLSGGKQIKLCFKALHRKLYLPLVVCTNWLEYKGRR